jgi:hypothetical protein
MLVVNLLALLALLCLATFAVSVGASVATQLAMYYSAIVAVFVILGTVVLVGAGLSATLPVLLRKVFKRA